MTGRVNGIGLLLLSSIISLLSRKNKIRQRSRAAALLCALLLTNPNACFSPHPMRYCNSARALRFPSMTRSRKITVTQAFRKAKLARRNRQTISLEGDHGLCAVQREELLQVHKELIVQQDIVNMFDRREAAGFPFQLPNAFWRARQRLHRSSISKPWNAGGVHPRWQWNLLRLFV